MNENQRKWLLNLQDKWIKFDIYDPDYGWVGGTVMQFNHSCTQYRLPDQPIPDIPDWRELRREMQSNGVRFKMLWGSMWSEGHYDFENERDRYQICEQPLPEWKDEEMTEETKPDQREEIPHRELQILWHEDMLHHLRTGEPMREWQWRKPRGAWQWLGEILPTWTRDFYYRRKPKTVTYWHCAVMFDGLKSEVITGYCKDEVSDQNKRCKEAYPDAKFSPITETTVEVED